MVKYEELEIDKTELDVIISQKSVSNFDFKRELGAQENWSWNEVDELVKKYKLERLSEEEKLELEEEIFRANFTWLYEVAKKNTYVIEGYNSDDIYSCMFFAHRNLLEQFKIIKFYSEDEKVRKSGSQISFRYFLKQYFASRFHRYFVEGCKDFKGNYSLENNIKQNISANSIHEDFSIYDEKCEEDINKIEISDMNLKEEIRKAVREELDKDTADCILIYFKLLKRNNSNKHLGKRKIVQTAKNNLWRLRSSKRLKELFEYYVQYMS